MEGWELFPSMSDPYRLVLRTRFVRRIFRVSIMQAVMTIESESLSMRGPSNQEAVYWLRDVALKKDKTAFEKLYGQFAPRIKSYMMRHGAESGWADDLAQETMVQIWRKAGQYDPSKAVPAAWIFRIARNLQIDRLRRRKLHEVELTAEADRPDERERRPGLDRDGRVPEPLPDAVRPRRGGHVRRRDDVARVLRLDHDGQVQRHDDGIVPLPP